jgi:hypothetical protein
LRIGAIVDGPVSSEAGSRKEATMADTEATAVHSAEVVRYDDPVIITERVAVSAFVACYTGPTRRSYATDLRIFAGWCHDHGVDRSIGAVPNRSEQGVPGHYARIRNRRGVPKSCDQPAQSPRT